MEPLLRPSLIDHVPRTYGASKPWRVGSQVYVAFLGGPVAVMIIALINAGRLRMTPRDQVLIAVAGVAGAVAAVAAIAAIAAGGGTRVLISLAGILAFGPMWFLQRVPDRVYVAFSPREDEDDDYDSLVGPGIGAILAGLVVSGSLVAALGA